VTAAPPRTWRVRGQDFFADFGEIRRVDQAVVAAAVTIVS